MSFRHRHRTGCPTATSCTSSWTSSRELDVRSFHAATQSKGARGARSYAPDLMVALLLYGYCTGVFSSRRIARATYEDVPFRVIAGERHPHLTRVAAFRREHLRQLEGLSSKYCDSVRRPAS
ncbi:MAG: transposase [Deltaproteobacteria bacterium]